MAKRKKKRTGLVTLDPSAVLLRMCDQNIAPTDLRGKEKRLFVSGETWQRIFDGGEIRMQSAFDVAKGLGVPLRSLLHAKTLLELNAGETLLEPGDRLPDWRIEEPCRHGEASNGLTYFVWWLKHRVERDRYARGKRYDVSELRREEQERVADYLARHGEVCEKVGGLPQFPQHYTVQPDPDGKSWWCLDRWTPGEPLDELIYREGVPKAVQPKIMRDIAKGLAALHKAGVIYREMSTRSIIVVDADKGNVVLTDFELGKMLDSSPTVRGQGPGNPYQAPEVEGKTLTEKDTHVDWYGWARILLHVTTGGLPPKGQEGPCIEQADLPDRVRKIVAKCLSPEPRARPRTAKGVLRAIQWWR